MGMIINIDAGLENRTDYNILREPINDMLKNKQEAWEQKNPIDLLFHRGTINKFQETYTDSIGFARAFKETNDYAVAPIFNTHEGFSKVYTTRTFQGGFIITQQLLEDQQYNSIKNTASRFMTRWHGDQVEYAMAAIASGLGVMQTFGDDANGGESDLLMTSADTADGDIHNGTKNPLFTNNHTIVKRKGMSAADLLRRNSPTVSMSKTAPQTVSTSMAMTRAKLRSSLTLSIRSSRRWKTTPMTMANSSLCPVQRPSSLRTMRV